MQKDSSQSNGIDTNRMVFETVQGVGVGSIAAVAGMLTGEFLIASIFKRNLPAFDKSLRKNAILWGIAGGIGGGAWQLREALLRDKEVRERHQI